MASGKASGGVFGGNPTGKSPSSGISHTKIGSGQTLNSAYPPDNQSGYPVENTKGGSFGGSTTNLSHSLNGASVVQDPHKYNRKGI